MYKIGFPINLEFHIAIASMYKSDLEILWLSVPKNNKIIFLEYFC